MRLLALMVLTGFLLAGCTTDSSDFTTPPTDDEGNYVIEMRAGNLFFPKRAEVPAGATVVWKNMDPSIPHNTKGDGWQSPLMEKGQTFNHTFESSGDFAYECTLHAGMDGVIRVV